MKFILTGMPGCGKSSLGRNAARKLHCRFCDLDAWIEKTERRTITEIFGKDGEDGFRRIETAALKTALSTPDTDEHEIISSGGGIVVRSENLKLMSGAFVIFIDRPTEYIKSDIDTSARPLLADGGDRLQQLFNERIPLYTKSCNARILNNGSFSDALGKLTTVIQAEISKLRRKNMKIMVINGPNLDFLGIREPGVYGTQTYSDLESKIETHAEDMGIETVVMQSNSEGDIIDYIHYARGNYDGIIINPGAYTHYSYAIADALSAVSLPTVEVHISNIHKREEFRHKSVTAPQCIGQICGLGFSGYTLAMDFLIGYITDTADNGGEE